MSENSPKYVAGKPIGGAIPSQLKRPVDAGGMASIEGATRQIQRAEFGLPEIAEPSAPDVAYLVAIYGERLGQRFVLDAAEMGSKPVIIGRDEGLGITLAEDAVSRNHAKIRFGERGVYIEDLGSTNGTFVNDRGTSSARLKHGDLIKIGATILKYIESSNIEAAYYEEIYRVMIIDGLTGAYNRRYLEETLERELARARRHGRPLSLAMFDIDHFKKINDRFGHLTGDYVLRDLGAIVRGRVRQEEVFARYGGEEFVVMLPETGLRHALLFAEALRSLLERHDFVFDDQRIPVTVSVGVAEFEPNMRNHLELLAAADRKLYDAKDGGRNCVKG